MKSLIIFIISLLAMSCVIGDSSQVFSKIYLTPFYRTSMAANTDYTYSLIVDPPDGITNIKNAMITFQVYYSPTVTYTLSVKPNKFTSKYSKMVEKGLPLSFCNNKDFTISTTYAGAGMGYISFDCSNIIRNQGNYSLVLNANKGSGASYGWVDLTYMNNPKGTPSIFGTEYSTGEKGTIFIQLNDNQGLPINNGICYVNVYYPNLPNTTHPKWLNNVAMQYLSGSDGLYYYDLNVPSIYGIYMVSATCSYGYQFYWVYNPLGITYPQQNTTIGFCSGSPLNIILSSDYRYVQCQSDLMSKYNITRILSSGIYLVNGTVTASDGSFFAQTNITLGLKDNNNTTQYIVYTSNKWFFLISNQGGSYRFEESSGTVINDSSVFKNNGKNYGAKYQSSKGTNNTGTYSLFFNSTALVNVTSNAQNSFDYPKPFTIGCWVNATKSSAATRGIISKGYVSASNENYNMYFDGVSNRTYFGVGNGTTNAAFSTAINTVIQGRLTHMAVTANDTKMCIYIDGTLKTCASVTVNWKSVSGALMIGRQSKASNPFLGKIDECAIFNYSVSRTAIKNWYDGGLLNYETQGKTIKAIFQPTNSTFTNYLKVMKTTTGTDKFKIYSYLNSTQVSSNYVGASLVKGLNTINISKIVTTNNYALGFRIFSNETKANISEISLLAEKRDVMNYIQSTIYSYNISAFDLTNVTNIDLIFLGESSDSGTIIFYVYNYTSSTWKLLPNSLIFHATAVNQPSGIDEMITNSLPIKDIFGTNKIIKIKQYVNDLGSSSKSFTNLLNINMVNALGTIIEVKGGGEIHVRKDSSLNVTLNPSVFTNISKLVWSYANRNLTYYSVTQVNYTKIQKDIWNYEGNVTTNLLSQLASTVWNYVARYIHGEII